MATAANHFAFAFIACLITTPMATTLNWKRLGDILKLSTYRLNCLPSSLTLAVLICPVYQQVHLRSSSDTSSDTTSDTASDLCSEFRISEILGPGRHPRVYRYLLSDHSTYSVDYLASTLTLSFIGTRIDSENAPRFLARLKVEGG
ncbi:hypothetical protein F4823DRAFT_7428 [Ustulina deusta]|nr:hypothetical protein F4823DRAFT_7428 [Ustulina deusta]